MPSVVPPLWRDSAKEDYQGAEEGTYTQPVSEPIHRMVPERRARIYGRNARAILSAPNTLTLPVPNMVRTAGEEREVGEGRT